VTDAPPRASDVDVRGALRSLLVEYNEESIAAGLGVEPGTPTSAIRDLDARVDALNEPLRTLMRLFILSSEVDGSALEAAVDPEHTDVMVRAGLIVRDGERYRPTVRLTPFGPWIVASDLLERHVEGAPDFVLGPFGTTRRLAALALPGPFDSVLDLGAGGGALALELSASSARVVATDVNERAVAFARFNAAINGADHMDGRVGSLFEPVGGERFDLIVCNPPYVISPDDTFVYRDGGTEICRAIVRDAPAHLNDGGHLQMLAEWPQRAGKPWHAEVEAWLDGLAVDAWVLREYQMSPDAYAETWLKQEYHRRGGVPEGEVARWREHLAGLGVEAVAGGLIVIGTGRGGEPIRSYRDMPSRGKDAAGPSLGRWLSAQRLFAEVGDSAEILDAPLVPAPTLERTRRSEPTGSGWNQLQSELRPREGLRFGANVDPVAEEVVGLMGPGRTARQAMEEMAREHGVPVELFVDGLPGVISKLLELGVLVPEVVGARHRGEMNKPI